MKKKIIMVALLVSAFFGKAMADTVQTLTVNGEKIEKVVTQITFSGDNVVLHFDNEEMQYPMDNVEIAFSVTTGINAISTFRLNGMVGDALTVSGLPEGTQIAVYDATGKKLATAKAQAETTQVSLGGVAAGVYIMKAGNQIVKFVKR